VVARLSITQAYILSVVYFCQSSFA